jgi:ribosomal-protein-alanine N-acetyltransferase
MLNLNFNPFPILTTQRLVLRQITIKDAAALYALRSNETVMQYIDKPLAKSLADAVELIEKTMDALTYNDGITWAICLADDLTMIGTIGYWKFRKEHYRAEIGYLLLPEYQGKGIMFEAMQTVIRYGFQQLHLHSIEANVNPDNVASIGILEKNGFVREAYYKEDYYFEGKFLDTGVYSLLEPKFISLI